MKKLLGLGMFCFLCFAGTGCLPTHFSGSPVFPGGPAGCLKKCNAWHMDFGGMVAMGEYSTACVCEPKRKDTQVQSSAKKAGGVTAAAVGVISQMRAAQQQQQQMMMH